MWSYTRCNVMAAILDAILDAILIFTKRSKVHTADSELVDLRVPKSIEKNKTFSCLVI